MSWLTLLIRTQYGKAWETWSGRGLLVSHWNASQGEALQNWLISIRVFPFSVIPSLAKLALQLASQKVFLPQQVSRTGDKIIIYETLFLFSSFQRIRLYQILPSTSCHAKHLSRVICLTLRMSKHSPHYLPDATKSSSEKNGWNSNQSYNNYI